MAQECTESSVTISPSTPPNWWDLHHASSHSSWTNNTSPWHQSNPSSNSSCDEDVSMSTSFTNASNHSGLTVESSQPPVETACSNELIENASDGQIWSHILLSVGSNTSTGELHNNSQEVEEHILDVLSTKSSGMFEPAAACDYFKKIDNLNWEFTSSTSFNNFEKRYLNGGFSESFNMESGNSVNKLVNQLSIAPPHQEISRRRFDINPLTCNISLSSSANQYYSHPQRYSDGMGNNSGFVSACDHQLKVENEPPGAVFRRSFINGCDIGLNNSSSVVGDNNKHYYSASDATSTTARNFGDVISFSSRLGKAMIGGRKQAVQTASPIGKEKGSTNEGKKKRTEDNSGTVLKKPKQENSTVSSEKMQVPKVKFSERITALQQIVSPFGRTDTASVLHEAIQYIKFLQEQVQLLSNPYMSNSHKDPWGGLDRKDKGDAKLDLRSRGLCLVPVSCTPQVYHENTGSDYWTPTYRGCLYR